MPKGDYSLYLVTDRKILGKKGLPQAVEEAILGGVALVQLREKELTAREFYQLALEVKAVTDKYQVPLLINDRLDIALAIDAAGVHLGQKDLPGEVARGLLGPEKILGLSAATLEEARLAQEAGADYLGVGALFPTQTKNDTREVTIEGLKKIKESIRIPVVAIGGINESNVHLLKDTGIDGVAVVSAILGKPEPQAASKELRRLFTS